MLYRTQISDKFDYCTFVTGCRKTSISYQSRRTVKNSTSPFVYIFGKADKCKMTTILAISLLVILLATSSLSQTSSAPIAKCNAQADIVFLLDSSGSVGSADFGKILTFVKDVVQSFNIGPDDVQVGVDTFESTVRSEFDMNRFHDQQSVLNAINRIGYQAGGTRTSEAIRFMRTNSFSAAAGNRPNVQDVAIVITDGSSYYPSLTEQEAKMARDAGIILFAIGVGYGPARTELNAIATDPDSTHVYIADNFNALKSLKALLSDRICEVAKPTAPVCKAKADIVFILDSSGTIDDTEYNKMLKFVKDVTSKFDIGADKIRVGVELFSAEPYIKFHLNTHLTDNDVTNALANIQYEGGWDTDTAQALKDAYAIMFTAKNGDRPGIPNIAIVVTDGISNDKDATVAEAKKMKDKGIRIFAVGIGNKVNIVELEAIATDKSHVLTAEDFSTLTKIQAELNRKACTGTKFG